MNAAKVTAGLAPTRVRLDNGVVVIAKETRKTPAVTLNVAVSSGAICDPPAAIGAMNLLARVIDRGTLGTPETRSRTAAEIAEELDGRGVTLNVGVTRHLVSFTCTCLASDFDAIMALLADIIRSPSFPESEVVTRKAEVVTAIAQDDDSPFVKAAEELIDALYGAAHPYGRKLKGTVESIEPIGRADLAALHAARFAPTEVTVVVVGDVPAASAVEITERVLGGWKAPSPDRIALPAPVRSSERRRIVVPMMNKAQADIAYGFLSITRADPRYYAFWLMNNILGQYALGGRLGDSIRERQGMAYYVSSALEAQFIEGPLLIRAGVSPENVDRAVASIDEEMTRMRRDGVTEKELNESRQFLIGSMPRNLETNAGIANFLQRSEVFSLGLDFDVRVAELLRSVTLEQVNEAARIFDPAVATVVIAGPYEG